MKLPVILKPQPAVPLLRLQRKFRFLYTFLIVGQNLMSLRVEYVPALAVQNLPPLSLEGAVLLGNL